MNSTTRKIYFRADGNSKIGLGHVIRCTSLIDILSQDFQCYFVIRNPESKIKQIIIKYCSLITLTSDNLEDEVHELKSLLHKDDTLILDGHNFNGNYQKFIRKFVHKLIMIDDKADLHYFADLVINHGEIETSKYHTEPYTKILSGLSYAIVRKEFLQIARSPREIIKSDTVFICLGGADPFNITSKATLACLSCAFIKKIIIVTGQAFQNKLDLDKVLSLKKDQDIIYRENLDSLQMIELMKNSDIAVSPTSTISLEICCVKMGLITGTVIDNQEAIHRSLLNNQCSLSVGDLKSATHADITFLLEKLRRPDKINSIMKNQAKVIDGFSGERLKNEICKLILC